MVLGLENIVLTTEQLLTSWRKPNNTRYVLVNHRFSTLRFALPTVCGNRNTSQEACTITLICKEVCRCRKALNAFPICQWQEFYSTLVYSQVSDFLPFCPLKTHTKKKYMWQAEQARQFIIKILPIPLISK